MQDLRTLFESEYTGKQRLFETLIKPIFSKAKDTSLTDKQVLADSDKKQIKSFSIIAQVRGGFPIVFADVELQDTVALKRSRVNIQNCVRKVMEDDTNAIIFFHFTDNAKEWRISYVHRAETYRNSTSAKRYTYLCGPEHSCRTVSERFATLKGLSTIKDEDMIEAFSVEPLSKDFFDKYREHYADLVEYISGKRFIKKGGKFVEEKTKNANGSFENVFEGDDKAVRDFVKKMMGRLVFLQFLQKKGWLGVKSGDEWGSGDKNFLKNLFENASKEVQDDFLEQALEQLFFKTLNTSRDDEAIAPKKLCDIYGSSIRIPYLNGGLFEEDELDKKKVKFKKEHFASLFEFFNQYNFTIDETDPDDTEIGVDPEMLGKIFENLLEDNKDKGAFYTPKEIVQYMCRESLIAYLSEKILSEEKIRNFVLTHEQSFTAEEKADILEALRDVKICDPAVGSGAFPMGMLNELLACTQALMGESKSRAELKKHIVKNNIYGVDIEKGAVDIARLRFWLAIIVDEEEPLPLPNLDYKIMQGNSLLESFEGEDLSKLTKKHEYDDGQQDMFGGEDSTIASLAKAIDGFYVPSDQVAKAKIRKQIAECVIQLLKEREFSPKIIEELEKIELHENSKFFLWHTWFNDVFNRPQKQGDMKSGFDIVIGNPPYVGEGENSFVFKEFKETSPYYIGKMNLWYGFACHGIDLLKENGILCFIATNNWTTTAGGKKLRNKIMNDTKIIQLLDFNSYMIFESASIQTMVMMFQKDSKTDNYTFDYRKLTKLQAKKEDIFAMLNKTLKQADYFEPKIPRLKFKDKNFVFSAGTRDLILDKMAENAEYLNDNDLAQGIVPNPDVVNARNIKNISAQKINKEHIKIGDGVFVVRKGHFDKLNSSEKKYIKPLFEPKDLERYYIGENSEEILYITKKNYKTDAPNLIKHLSKYREIMEERRENKNGRINYYNLHWSREEKFFNKGEKILSVRKCIEHPVFAYTQNEAYVMMAINVIKTSRFNLKFLTGLFNSKAISFWLKNRGKMQGENFQIDKEPLMAIPIPQTTNEQQKPIIALVEKILSAKKQNPAADTSALEAQIDSLVYKLYNFTIEEIAVVEGR